jgi:cold shock CspA family protein
MVMTRQFGTVVRVLPDKGFGFLADRDSGTEYFFHRSGVTRGTFETMARGTTVTFEVEPSAKGPRACRVEVA